MKSNFVKLLTVLLVLSSANFLFADRAADIIKTSGIQGGLVVCLGSNDGKFLSSLRKNGRYLVQGLETDAAKVSKARETIEAAGTYGSVTAGQFDGKVLPYSDELVNLLVIDSAFQVPNSEILRVLAPEGVALMNGKKMVKPRPGDIDQWSHWLHDSGGNAVAMDRKVGPPRSLRWVAGPRWSRSHEMPTSVGSTVTSGGRIFMIFDDAPPGVFHKLPSKVSIVARDAANGILLWKKPLQAWQAEDGTGEGNRWQIHHTIPRRIVAEGNRVYATLRFNDSPVSVLDAATGKILIDSMEGTKGTDEIIVSGNILLAKTTKEGSVGAAQRFGKEDLADSLVACNAQTGKQLWRKDNIKVIPHALSAKYGRTLYHNMDGLVCLDTKTGKQLWTATAPIESAVGASCTLVVIDDTVLFHGPGKTEAAPEEKEASGKKKKSKKKGSPIYMTAYSLADGKQLWRNKGAKGPAAAGTFPSDVFVTHGTVWCGNSMKGWDLQTGAVKQELDLGHLISPGHHYRCHHARASERYLIWPKRGAEFIDVEKGEHMRNDWLRAPCFTGTLPANGLLYVPPSQCFCYPGAKVFGFLAMSAKKPQPLKPSTAAQLVKGPAYAQVPDLKSQTAPADWPMYRRTPQRSGSVKTTVPAQPAKQWETKLGCKATPPVIVGNRLWVAEKEAHRIRCIDADTGKDVWSYTAGGRIDSAPTIHGGAVFFGCRDGKVYCLRATDGALAWSFRAAPGPQHTVSFEQVESVWPVQGSVLVQDGKVYFAAGRSSYLDGGIVAYALDAQTGKPLHHHILEGPWPDIKTDVGTPFAMEGSLTDLFVSDGKNLYMQRVKFDGALNRLETKQESSLGELDMGANHLAATGGFLDDSGFDRLYWMYSKQWPGFYFAQHAPKAGQLVVFDDATTYAVKYFYRRHVWSPLFIPEEQGYLLFADDNHNEPNLEDKQKTVKALDWIPGAADDTHRRGGRGTEKGMGYIRETPAKWQEFIPLRIRAMVLAGDKIVAAGPADKLNPNDLLDAFESRSSAMLNVYSAKDGRQLSSQEMESFPAFDGLAAANGKLYLSTEDGKIICFK
ncbi:MAG: PQQ-binding-like beta-propeller repeat protein [Kiritimatiellales bacterium]|nr:PQQ-binding-like beta-propeller repeat protein [Kiritimatiellales bacterium]